MSAINGGGPAFPIPMLPGEQWQTEQFGDPNGMSLRDWFAGMALQGILSGIATWDSGCTAQNACEMAYSLSDAMLATRKESK